MKSPPEKQSSLDLVLLEKAFAPAKRALTSFL
jgi:hypothetical protein